MTPIPVGISVTSALTGGPLAASLTMPDGSTISARADGRATLYRIGAGEAVIVAAAGYQPARAVIGSNLAAAVALAPTMATTTRQLQAWDRARDYQAIIDWVLRPATGYIFMGTSKHDWAKQNEESAGADPQTAYIGGGYTGISSVNGGMVDVSVTIWISWPGDRWDTAGIARGVIGTGAHQVPLAGQRAWHGGPDSHHNYSTLWSSDPVFVITTGPDQAKIDAAMTGIIKAMGGGR